MEKVRADKLKAKLAEDEINVTDSVADVIRYHPYSTDHYISTSTNTGSFFSCFISESTGMHTGQKRTMNTVTPMMMTTKMISNEETEQSYHNF